MTSAEQSGKTLADHPFLSSIPIEALNRLAVHVKCCSYAPGEQIFLEGDPAEWFFLIQRGLVRLELEVAGTGRVEVETLGPDTALGWSWLFSPRRWHLSATATEKTTALVFEAGLVRSLMSSDPVIGYELMRRFATVIFDRLQATRRRLSEASAAIPTADVGEGWAGSGVQASQWRTG